MADREYLTSMIQRAVGGTSRYWAGLIADYLLAHGVMPVVCCQECKHRRDDEDYASGHYCVKRPSNGGYFCEDADFCSYGERRADNG